MARLGSLPRVRRRRVSLVSRQSFPKLTRFAKTSDATWGYNCHAWGADDAFRWWEPIDWRPPHVPAWVRIYWPQGLPRNDYSLDNFIAAFRTRGFEVCDNASLEPDVEKIALYVLDGWTTHTARQLPWGTWTSKLGNGIDIEHATPHELEGPAYGSVVTYMKRPRQSHLVYGAL